MSKPFSHHATIFLLDNISVRDSLTIPSTLQIDTESPSIMPPPTLKPACAAARGLDLAFVSVLLSGTVTTTNIPASLGVAVGSKMSISFLTLPAPTDRIANDGSNVHITDGIGAYLICTETFAISFDGSSMKGVKEGGDDLFLAIVSKRPVNDGMYISPSATVLKAVPIKVNGTGTLYPPEWTLDFSAVYERGTFSSLHMQQIAEKTYGKEGLQKYEVALSTQFYSNTVLEASIDSIQFTPS